MRKKFDHVSKLHVIHHGIMPMSVWFGVKFTPGTFKTYFIFIFISAWQRTIIGGARLKINRFKLHPSLNLFIFIFVE